MFKNVIAVFGVGRSGTSWLGQILDSCPKVRYKYQPLFSYAFKGAINRLSSSEEINDFFHQLYEREDEFLDQVKQRKSGIYPEFSHEENPEFLVFKEMRYLYLVPTLLEKIENIRIIAITRDPVGVMESWFNAPREFYPEWDIEEEWMFAPKKNQYRAEEYYGYNKWRESTHMFYQMQKDYPEKLIRVSYEKLCEECEKTTKKIFDFCKLPYTEQTRKFLMDSQSKTVGDEYGVFRKKGEVRKKEKELPKNILDYIKLDLKSMEKYL